MRIFADFPEPKEKLKLNNPKLIDEPFKITAEYKERKGK